MPYGVASWRTISSRINCSTVKSSSRWLDAGLGTASAANGSRAWLTRNLASYAAIEMSWPSTVAAAGVLGGSAIAGCEQPATTIAISAPKTRRRMRRTSAPLAELHHPDEFEDELQRRQAGDVSAIERRRQFIDVESGDWDAAQLAQKIKQLTRGQAARGRHAGARRVGGVQRIDVQRKMQGVGANPRSDLVGQLMVGPAVGGCR